MSKKEYVDREQLFELVYPVGSIYLSAAAVPPSTLFGIGKQEQIQDAFLLGCGAYASAGSIGGSENHTHNYGIKYGGFYKGTIIEKNTNAGLLDYNEDNTWTLSTETNLGNVAEVDVNGGTTKDYQTVSVAHYTHEANTSYTSNMPPYLAVYIWKRVS